MFVNIFSHPISCLFILLIVSFTVQKLLNLMGSHLLSFILLFSFLPSKTDPRKYCCHLSQGMSCLWSLWLHVFSLFYMWLSTFLCTTCWSDCLLSVVYSWLLCHLINCMTLFLGSVSCSIDLCFCTNTTLFGLLWLCNIAWILEWLYF